MPFLSFFGLRMDGEVFISLFIDVLYRIYTCMYFCDTYSFWWFDFVVAVTGLALFIASGEIAAREGSWSVL